MKTIQSRICAFFVLSLLAIPLCEARVAVSLNIGPVVESPYGPNVVWVPGHWDHGYWIPGQYLEYAGAAPGPDYLWIGGSAGHGHHWNHGHWHHH